MMVGEEGVRGVFDVEGERRLVARAAGRCGLCNSRVAMFVGSSFAACT